MNAISSSLKPNPSNSKFSMLSLVFWIEDSDQNADVGQSRAFSTMIARNVRFRGLFLQRFGENTSNFAMNFDGVMIFYPFVDDGSKLCHSVLQSAVGVGHLVGLCMEMICRIHGPVLPSDFQFKYVDDAASDATPEKLIFRLWGLRCDTLCSLTACDMV